MNIKITADSTCDLSLEIIERYNIDILTLYVVDNENATVTITGWAVGRTSNLYNNTQLDFYRDFINMNEFMKFRVMATC